MYPLVYHKTLTPEKWAGYSRTQQILSVANELNRARNALLNNNPQNAVLAWERAFELIDMTVEDKKSKPLLKELLRFRELLGEVYLTYDLSSHQKLMKALITFDPGAYNALTDH